MVRKHTIAFCAMLVSCLALFLPPSSGERVWMRKKWESTTKNTVKNEIYILKRKKMNHFRPAIKSSWGAQQQQQNINSRPIKHWQYSPSFVITQQNSIPACTRKKNEQATTTAAARPHEKQPPTKQIECASCRNANEPCSHIYYIHLNNIINIKWKKCMKRDWSNGDNKNECR